MAYDKVVDSSVLDAGLTQIANAIREKAGTSDSLAFPTAMAEAIAAIEAGGGSLRIIEGSFTMSQNTQKNNGFTVEHNLGKVPIFASCYADARFSGKGTTDYFISGFGTSIEGFDQYGAVMRYDSSTAVMFFTPVAYLDRSITALDASVHISNATKNTITFGGSGVLPANCKYNYVLGVLE